MVDGTAMGSGAGGRAPRGAEDTNAGLGGAAAGPILRIEDAGRGMADVAVSQTLSREVARHIASILRDAAEAPRRPAARRRMAVRMASRRRFCARAALSTSGC